MCEVLDIHNIDEQPRPLTDSHRVKFTKEIKGESFVEFNAGDWERSWKKKKTGNDEYKILASSCPRLLELCVICFSELIFLIRISFSGDSQPKPSQ